MKISLKRVSENDLELLMNWRNSEEISKNLFVTTKLTMENQIKWFEKLKKDKTQIRWIIYVDGIPVGSVYFTDIDEQNKRCEMGFFIAKREYRSLTTFLTLRWNMYDYAFYQLGMNRIYGYVLAENKGVIRLTRVGGSGIEGTMKEHIWKDGKFHDVVVVGMTKRMWEQRRLQFTYDKIDME